MLLYYNNISSTYLFTGIGTHAFIYGFSSLLHNSTNSSKSAENNKHGNAIRLAVRLIAAATFTFGLYKLYYASSIAPSLFNNDNQLYLQACRFKHDANTTSLINNALENSLTNIFKLKIDIDNGVKWVISSVFIHGISMAFFR